MVSVTNQCPVYAQGCPSSLRDWKKRHVVANVLIDGFGMLSTSANVTISVNRTWVRRPVVYRPMCTVLYEYLHNGIQASDGKGEIAKSSSRSGLFLYLYLLKEKHLFFSSFEDVELV